ncbi:hypothetical protein DAPPUDRAFT_267240 [Daphnia pulex]|uniref:Uncharacterized protein n=1 Tax=Daphnia pulex TaxID=6669 RepID=E9HW80_DAPPU|nr:hypothetical protein DAPPUDRAFT_267240 [Daphnia pulex]|eukprot:EFX63999.1 hypothetical protein DAPPUDRAFT_267240 [Daphnia pulex]
MGVMQASKFYSILVEGIDPSKTNEVIHLMQHKLMMLLSQNLPLRRKLQYQLQPADFKVIGEDNIAALLEDEPSDFEETDYEIESLSDHGHDNEKEDQGESAMEQESESKIQENTDADMNPISLTAILNSGKDATNIYILPPHRRTGSQEPNGGNR